MRIVFSLRLFWCFFAILIVACILSGCDISPLPGSGPVLGPTFNQPPIAAISIDPSQPPVGGQITFDGSQSQDPDGPDDALQFRWEIRKGAASYSASVKTFTDRFWEPGLCEVTLTVIDINNARSVARQYVTIGNRVTSSSSVSAAPEPDELGFCWSVTDDPSHLKISFDASQNGDICSYGEPRFLWDFGDGSGDVGECVEHVYAQPGMYEIAVQVVCPSGDDTTIQSPLTVGIADGTALPEIGFIGPFGVGNGSASPENEYVTVKNFTNSQTSLQGWSIESSAGYFYWFPSWFVLGPDATVTIHTGIGEDSGTNLYWESIFPVWRDLHGIAILRDANNEVVDQTRY